MEEVDLGSHPRIETPGEGALEDDGSGIMIDGKDTAVEPHLQGREGERKIDSEGKEWKVMENKEQRKTRFNSWFGAHAVFI